MGRRDRRARTDPERLVREVAAAGARLLVVVDRAPERAMPGADVGVDALLARAGAHVLALDRGDVAEAERAIRAAADVERGGGRSGAPDGPGSPLAGVATIVALSRCIRGTRAGPPLGIASARCNRCGACLSLACPAISDRGGEAMKIDAAICTGCGLCAPLCRGGAISAVR